MKKIRILIVDDSVVFRSQIRSALEAIDRFQVMGVAANGRIAIEKMKNIEVDLITLDLEMPVLNGIETLREIRRLGIKTKVIVFSSTSKRGSQNTLEALELGAVDFVAKPGGEAREASAESFSSVDLLQSLLVGKIEELFPKSLISEMKSSFLKSEFHWQKFEPKAILIGSSTGGPTALETIFGQLQGPFRCPILIVQHMPPIFTASLAQRISRLCGVPAEEGKDGELVTENKIYIAPGGFHMKIEKKGGLLSLQINQEPPENSVRPAVDPLFRSAAEIFNENCLGVILTGMGQDGLKGCQRLRDQGNPVIIQNRESCVVFGMPGAVFQAAAYDGIQNLEQITETLRSYVQVDPLFKKQVS